MAKSSRIKALSVGQKIDRWMVNEGARRIFIATFILLHLMVFIFGLMTYLIRDNQSNIRRELGLSYPIARAAALVLHLDVALILLPVCRSLISFARNTPLGSIIPFDKSVDFHKFIAWSIVLFSWVHTIAHWHNFAQLVRANQAGVKAWFFANLTTGPGVTGYIMLALLMLMVVSALGKHRRANFERFWLTHHLFILFFAMWQLHGSFCMITPDRAPFCQGTAIFWRFWLVGGAIYLFERLMREVRCHQKTLIYKVIQHPGRVCEVQFKRDNWSSKAGQYIFISCPELSLHQFHPFTLTSAPEEDYISVHMRCVGDFTNKLSQVLGCDFESARKGNGSSKRESRIVASTDDNRLESTGQILPTIMIDGPFGSASEDVFKFEAVMLCGAGIGVTPFASILKSIWYRINYPQEKVRLSKVYFFWICRDFESFEWFRSLLLAIEHQDLSHLIEIHTYLTAKISSDAAQNIMLNGADCDKDAITGLRAPVNFGRPPWDSIFDSITNLHPATDVGVFFW